MNSNIYVVRASHMQPFFYTLNNLEVPIEPLLENVGLALSQFEDPEALIPEAPLWAFVELASKKLSLPHFGFLVTENVCLDSYGVFGEHLCLAKNLETALSRFINNLNTHVNFPNYWLEENDGFVWLCRKGTPGIEKGKWVIEQHVISFLIELVRVYAGKYWQPQIVKFHSDNLVGIEHAKSVAKSKILKGQAFGAIAIEEKLLYESSKMNKPNYRTEVLNEKIPIDFDLTLKQLLQQGYFGNEITAEIVANKMQVNLRTLQRRLKDQNTTLQQLIDDVKYNIAQSLLIEKKLSVQQVSKQLGYCDKSNFTRAFKRWSGYTPKEFRKVNLDNN